MNVMDDDDFNPAPPRLYGTCDHCGPGVTAYLFAQVNGTILSFCASDGTRYYDRLVKAGRIVSDQRDLVPR